MRPQIPLQRFETFAEGLDHPEGLAFDADGDLWAGGELGQVYRINREGNVQTVAALGGFNLGLTFSATQDLFVCNFKLGALIQLDRSGKTIRSWERVGQYRLRNPNFSVFDREGNLYFTDSGAFHKDDGFCLFFGRTERSSNCSTSWRFLMVWRSAPMNGRYMSCRAPETMCSQCRSQAQGRLESRVFTLRDCTTCPTARPSTAKAICM